MNRATLIALALALLCPGLARAELLFNISAGPAVPTGRGEVRRFGAGATIGFALHLPKPDLVGLKVRRFHYGGLARAMTSALAFYRWRVPADDRLGAFLSLEGGFGLFSGCVENGACDAMGASLGAEAGVSVPVMGRLKLEIAFEPIVQIGMPGGAGVLVMPSLLLGIAAW